MDAEKTPLRMSETELAAILEANNKRRCKLTAIIAITLTALAGVICGIVLSVLEEPTWDTPPFADSILVENVVSHLQALNDIAQLHNGSRSIRFGYNASAEYVMSMLAQTDFSVTVLPFPVYVWTLLSSRFEASDGSVVYRDTQYAPLQYSGGGTYTNVFGVNPTGNVSGCVETDFDRAVTVGKLVYVQRGNCSFAQKAKNAQAAGAVAIAIYDLKDMGTWTLDAVPGNPITFALSYQLYLNLNATINTASFNLTFDVNFASEQTFNVIAETPSGSEDSLIVFGSHLDSVDAGPGINDNGSGSSTNLEIALQWYNSGLEAVNKIRFCWWGAEEVGLVGSTAYVNYLIGNGELDKVALNLNFDMLGSPNYFRGVYHGQDSEECVRNGSTYIQSLFTDYFGAQELPFEYTKFDGRSDYGPFIATGISAGGLASGAEGKKTMQQRTLYGGLANAAYDPCYHQDCDNIENINTVILEQNAKAAASVLETLALDESLRANLNNLRPSEMPACS